MNNLLKLPKNIRKKKINLPKKIALYLLNDDFTSMDFVVKILIMYFNKNNHEAEKLMMKVHTYGQSFMWYLFIRYWYNKT